MAKSILDKYKSIDQTKISKEAKTILLKIKVKTRNFKETTPDTNRVFNTFYSKLQESKPQAIKGYKAPTKATPKAATKSAPKASSKISAAQLLKEAKKRRANQGISTSKSDIEKDAVRPAKPKGYRITDGTHYPYVKGNKYWEGRENRLDRKQPPKKYPKLEHGGYMAKGGKLDVGVYRIGKPKKVNQNLYEQKIVEIFDNGDIATASDYGRKISDFNSYSYKIISKEQLDEQYKMEHGGYMARGGEIVPYIVWVQKKDGGKRELYGEYKSMRAANMKMDKLWESGEYERMGNKPKSMYEKEGFYKDGGYMAKGGGEVRKFDPLYNLTYYEDNDLEKAKSDIIKDSMEHIKYVAEYFGTDKADNLHLLLTRVKNANNPQELGILLDKISQWFYDNTDIETDMGSSKMERNSSMMAKGGKTEGVKWHKYENNVYEAELGNCDIRISPDTQKGYWSVYVKEGKKSIGQAHEVYGIDNAKDKAYSIVRSQYMADGGEVGQGFLIRDMREKLNRMFPDTFGFTVGNVSKEGNKTLNSAALIVDLNDPYRGLEDKDIQSKLFFPQYKRDHNINFRMMQRGENTYFYFELESEKGDEYIGQFGFKDSGDVPSSYITSFIAFLMEQYGLPFKIEHQVMAHGGKVGEPHRMEIGG